MWRLLSLELCFSTRPANRQQVFIPGRTVKEGKNGDVGNERHNRETEAKVDDKNVTSSNFLCLKVTCSRQDLVLRQTPFKEASFACVLYNSIDTSERLMHDHPQSMKEMIQVSHVH